MIGRTAIWVVCWGCLSLPTSDLRAADIDFNRQIRPILADHCYSCHGPDGEARQAELALHTYAGATAERDSGPVLVPGRADKSGLYARLIAADPEQRMPPPEAKSRPSQAEIGLIRDWINQGAPWPRHWAYQTIRQPRPPLADSTWIRNSIDAFTLAQMKNRQFRPSRPATREEILRRVSFDLTGLPPTLTELGLFLRDRRPDAYERAVDRLLQSPRFGERMAIAWMDLARYADTHGYHIDSHRDMWRWRDWVIEAYNDNLPFDQFTIAQLAGDLLPGDDVKSQIATGFLRNHMINFEGGAIPEEYLNEYVTDRVVTTSTVWMGQTLGCSRCHDHKYDPFTQEDFYRLYAFFNNVPEQGLDGRTGNAAPLIRSPSRLQTQRQSELESQASQLLEQLANRRRDSKEDQQAWEQEMLRGTAKKPQPPTDWTAYFPLDRRDTDSWKDATGRHQAKVQGSPIWLDGRYAEALLLDGETHLEIATLPALAQDEPFALAIWVFPTTADAMTLAAQWDSANDGRGWDCSLDDGHLQLRLVHKPGSNEMQLRGQESLELRTWQHVCLTYDGSGKSAGWQVYLNGRPQHVEVMKDQLDGSFAVKQPLCLGSRQGEDAFRGMLDDVKLFGRSLSATEAALLAGSNPLEAILRVEADQRTPLQQDTLQQYYLRQVDEPYRALHAKQAGVLQAQKQLEQSIPTTMVMSDRQPRETHLLLRGDYRHPGKIVEPGTPSVLPPMPRPLDRSRLGLARWLVDPAHPLTARVAVNRYWQLCFGRGLVGTPEDFGVRGEPPTHPELLDWLAGEFIRSGWDRKQLLRLIVTSATYRQSGRISPSAYDADPNNLWLARGPRRPLEAEFLRDNALALAGLLDNRLGGPSVYPYQPPGLWKEVSFNPRDFTAQVYQPSSGADLYRRSLYTFWKRAVPPPAMAAFGAPEREVCTVRRPRSNTPLQALVLMNDPTYVEAARLLAERIMLEGGDDPRAAIRWAVLHVLARRPSPQEEKILRSLYEDELRAIRRKPSDALERLKVGDQPVRVLLDPQQLAAWTMVASTLLNLDETITNH